MPVYRKINKDFFKEWGGEMAYILGFIFADGNIICTKRGTWYWSIQINDREMLEGMKKILNSSHRISKRKKQNKHKQLYRLQIGSKDMCEDLICLGLTERKSKTLLFPEVPNKYFSDFIRGYFDGDGGIWVGFINKHRKHKTYILSAYFTSGSKRFLISLKENLFKRGLKGGSIVKKERGFDLKYSIKDSLILHDLMYNDTYPLFLKRKRDKFEKYIEMRS